MKFQGIGFNERSLSKMGWDEFVANVAHSLPDPRQVHELFNLTHGNDQKPAGQLEEIKDPASDTVVHTDDTEQLH